MSNFSDTFKFLADDIKVIILKVAFVHSYYSDDQPSGENVIVDAQISALQSLGIDAKVFSRRTSDISKKTGYKFSSAFNVATGFGFSPLEEINKFQPDVIHVHNLFPNFGTNWLNKWDGPLVATLNNFRPVCASGTLLRESKFCNLCPDKGQIHGLIHSCYRGSKLATLPLTIRNSGGIFTDPVIKRADSLIVLSETARNMYLGFGLDPERIELIPNAISGKGFNPDKSHGNSWVFIGRLSEEKGISKLLKYWDPSQELIVYGDGPLRKDVLAARTNNIRYGGLVAREQIPSLLAESTGLVFPSECIEGGTPISYIEALAAGRPVLAFSNNSVAADVIEKNTGKVFQDWTALSEAREEILSDFSNLSYNASRAFTEHYSSDIVTSKLVDLYKLTIKRKQ